LQQFDPSGGRAYYRYVLNCLANGGWTLEQVVQVRMQQHPQQQQQHPPQAAAPPALAPLGPSTVGGRLFFHCWLVSHRRTSHHTAVLPLSFLPQQPSAIGAAAVSSTHHHPPLSSEEEVGLNKVLSELSGSKESITAGRQWIMNAPPNKVTDFTVAD
jgi:hypothetical protein